MRTPKFSGRVATGVVSTLRLREWEMFAISKHGDVVALGVTCSFFEFGALRVVERYVAKMTHVERLMLNISKAPKIFVVERLTDESA